MKRFLGVCVIWFVLLLICFMLFGNYLMSNFYVILLAVSLLLAIFTCVLISQSADCIRAASCGKRPAAVTP